MHENHKLILSKNENNETCKKYAPTKIRTRDGSDNSPRLFPLSHWACGYQPCIDGFIVTRRVASQSVKLNTDPNLTPNPIRTHVRAPNPNRPTSPKKLYAQWHWESN